MRAIIEIKSNTRCALRKASSKTIKVIDDALSVDIPGSEFNPRVREGMWDGKRHLFSKTRGTFPKGLLERVKQLLGEMGKRYKVKDLRKIKEAPLQIDRLTDNCLKGISLRPYQKDAARKALTAGSGILWLATNAGKTEVACAMMRVLKEQRVLFLVHKKVLLQQTRERIAKRFGTIEEHIGIIGEGRFDPRHITVATIQSLTRKAHPEKKKIIRSYLRTVRLLIVDEGHHTKATTWYRLIQSIDAPYRFILSGTPFGNDNGLLVEAAVGGVVARVSNEQLIDLGVSARPTITMVKCEDPELPEQLTWDEVYKRGVVENDYRNRLIAKRAAKFAKKKQPTLVLVRQLWHGDNILRELKARDVRAAFSHGKMPITMVERNKERLENGGIDVLIASTIYDEGVDVPAIRALVVADGGQSVRSVLQKIGRGLRQKEGDNRLTVIDFADMTHRFLAKHSQERLAIYEGEGFKVKTA